MASLRLKVGITKKYPQHIDLIIILVDRVFFHLIMTHAKSAHLVVKLGDRFSCRIRQS